MRKKKTLFFIYIHQCNNTHEKRNAYPILSQSFISRNAHPGVLRMLKKKKMRQGRERERERKSESDTIYKIEKNVCIFFRGTSLCVFCVHFIWYNDPYMLKMASNKPLTITYRQLFIFYADCGLNTHSLYAIARLAYNT